MNNNKREIKKSRAMTVVITLICVVVGTVMAVQFKTVAANKQSAGEQSKTLEELRTQLLHEINSKNLLDEEIKSLNDKIKVLEESSLSQQEELLKEEYRKAQMVAGLTNVSGSGIVITIGVNPNMTLSVNDLLQLVNDLRMAEAQAISINDERIVAMSEIAKGDYFIVVNGNTVAAPYVIKAIGDQEKLETMVNVPFGILSNLEQSGDWPVKVELEGEIQIPKIKDGSKSINTDAIKENTQK